MNDVTEAEKKTSLISPVRSLARSGWFMRQWLANFTHSSLTGTWMSLNLRGKHQKLHGNRP